MKDTVDIVLLLGAIAMFAMSPLVIEKALSQHAWPIIPLYLFVCLMFVLVGGVKH